MSQLTILENEFFTLWYYPKKKIVHHCFHKFVYGEPFRQCLQEGIVQLAKNQATKWLSDDRNNAALTKEDTNWCQRVWEPQAIESGLKYWAIVLPKSIVGQLYMTNISERLNSVGITHKLFSDPDEGINWLRRQ